MPPLYSEESMAEKSPSPPNSRYAWYVAIVLMLCYTLSFVDRQILSLLVSPIKADLRINDTRVGLLQGFSFALFYAFMGLPLGRIADYANRRNLIAVCITLWSLFTGTCAAAKSFPTLFLARIGVGVGEAGLNPASFSILADYFSKERLGAAVSVFYIGNLLGSSLALIVGGTTVQIVTQKPEVTLPILGTIASWRLTFLVVGLPGFLFALLVFTVREPLRKSLVLSSKGTSKLNMEETFRQLWARWQSVVGISAAFIFQAACNYGFTAWVPTYFLRAHGWGIGETGRALGFVILPFGCLGLYLGGYLSECWQRRGVVEGPLLVAIPSAIGIVLFLVSAMLMPTAAWSLALIGPGFFFLVLPMGTATAALQIIFPNQMRAQVAALYVLILNLGGNTLGTLIPGVFTDYLFKDLRRVGSSIALMMSIAGLLMLAVIVATLRPYRMHYRLLHPGNPAP
jgi:MFS family permease